MVRQRDPKHGSGLVMHLGELIEISSAESSVALSHPADCGCTTLRPPAATGTRSS